MNNEPLEIQVNTVVPSSQLILLALVITIAGIMIVIASQVAKKLK